MGLDLTIVYPPAIDYQFMHQRPQQMMKALAQAGANVVFINPADLFPQETPVYHPFPELPNFTVIHRSVDFKPLVKGKLVFWCAVNQGWFIDCYDHDLAIFDSCDLAAGEFSAWSGIIPVMEKKTQLTFASSGAIFREHTSRGVPTVLLSNGADFDHFKPAAGRLPRPADLPDTGGRPLVGYYGAIYTWLDAEMVYRIADCFPVVLIGSNQLYNRSIEHPNVTLLGMKPYRELPAYLSWFDAALIPFLLTEMIAGCDPVKFYEYISAGKPVVASNMQELGKFRNLVYFADAGNAAETVAKAIEENHEMKVRMRQRYAFKNSWTSRAKVALAHILNRLEKGGVYPAR
ncbi:glycosyltransferase [Paenibacillus humicola]|uniref:glycosyltransferase n=1 Tax=Paenibacillus humicola TaxID=3110540 RepID=UPI00237BEE32|nr:glycosyltransferase [Paenibacillus humicola]